LLNFVFQMLIAFQDFVKLIKETITQYVLQQVFVKLMQLNKDSIYFAMVCLALKILIVIQGTAILTII
jgi:hypothetical protein